MTLTEIGIVLDVELRCELTDDNEVIIDFPDIEETVRQYINTDTEMAMRLIYCNWKDNYSCHKFGYTDKSFRNFWDKNYVVYQHIIVKHDYPML